MNIVIDFDGRMCLWELGEDEVMRSIHLEDLEVSEDLKVSIASLETKWDNYNERLKRRAMVHQHDHGEPLQLNQEEWETLNSFPRVETLVADMIKQERPDWTVTLRGNFVHEAYYD